MRSIIISILILIVHFCEAQKFEVSLNKELSSSHSEYAPRLLGENDSYLMFTSNRQVSNGYENENIYYSENTNGNWGKITELIKNKTHANYGVITTDNERNVAFFTMCPILKGKNSHCSIYYSFLSGGLIGEVMPLNIPIDAEPGTFNIGMPYFSNELQILFFAARMPGGYGGIDIWFCKYDRKNDSWGKATNMGPEINSVKNDSYPFVNENGTLYFASEREGGFGGMDLYYSKLLDTLIWSVPKNLDQPLNTKGDDFGIVFRKGGSKGYFSSNRTGGLGGDDIYEFHTTDIQVASVATTTNTEIKKEKELKKALNSIFNKQDCSEDLGILCVSKVKIFPNPNNGIFNLEFYSNKEVNLKFRFYSSQGQLISIEEANIPKGTANRSYNLENIAKGIYYVGILFGCEILDTEKVIIE